MLGLGFVGFGAFGFWGVLLSILRLWDVAPQKGSEVAVVVSVFYSL